MIRSLTRSLISLVALAGLAGTAQAAFVPATWTDSKDLNQYVGYGQMFEYSHNIALDGFTPGTDIVDSFLLSIGLYDDHDTWYELGERVFVDLPGSDGDSHVNNSYLFGFEFGDNAYQGWSIKGIADLNESGLLKVQVSSECFLILCAGDFRIGNSTLVADGRTNGATSVPEPSTLALLGIGLLGIAAGARRRKVNVTK